MTDSITWRRFCRIGLEASVPDESTIRKITRRCGPELIDALNMRAARRSADERGSVDLGRVRVDTTVVEADIKYPTDSGLLTSASGRIAISACGGWRGRRGEGRVHRPHAATARAHQHSIGAWLRRRSDEAKAEVLVITGQLADLAERRSTEATQSVAAPGLAGGGCDACSTISPCSSSAPNQVIAQARTRVDGGQPDGATRLVSLHEPDARPIRKGRLGKPVEFGYKAQVVDNADGIIIDHSVHIGNPSDTDLLRPAIERITAQFADAPAVTADRGYWDSHHRSRPHRRRRRAPW